MIERVDPEVWQDRIKRLDVLRDMVAKNIERAGDKQERLYNRGKKHVTFNVGDSVMRRVDVLSNAAKRFNAELAPKFEGPFKILEVKSLTVYVLNAGVDGSRLALTHVSELKRYVPPRGVNNTKKRYFVLLQVQRRNEKVQPEREISPSTSSGGPCGDRRRVLDR